MFNGCKYFSPKTTVPMFDEIIRSDEGQQYYNRKVRVVMMSPREYLEWCAKRFNTTYARQIGTCIYDKKLCDKYIAAFKRGDVFPACYISYHPDDSQEGRHRMYALGQIEGMDTKFPVYEFSVLDEERLKKDKHDDFITKQLGYFNKIVDKALDYRYESYAEFIEEINWLLEAHNGDYDTKLNVTLKQETDTQFVFSVEEEDVEYKVEKQDITIVEKKSDAIEDDFDYDDLDLENDPIYKKLFKENMELTESRYAPLYHATTVRNLKGILSTNTLNVGRTYVKDENDELTAAVSLTRDIAYAFTHVGCNAIIELNKEELLVRRYKIIPTSDYANFLGVPHARKQGDSKAEECVTKPIDHVKNYINQIFIKVHSNEEAKEIEAYLAPDIIDCNFEIHYIKV